MSRLKDIEDDEMNIQNLKSKVMVVKKGKNLLNLNTLNEKDIMRKYLSK